jgi:hypothetical protein
MAAMVEQLAASTARADEDVRAARKALTQFEEQYAFWTAEYLRRARELREFEETPRARKPSNDVIHRREFLRQELHVATHALEMGVQTLKGAQQELEHARAFFLRLVDVAKAPVSAAPLPVAQPPPPLPPVALAVQEPTADVSYEPVSEPSVPDVQAVGQRDTTDLRRRYFWNQRSQYVPEDFQFPRCNTELMWDLWCRGDAEKHYPPFRLLRGTDLPTANARKRLSDLRLLMAEVEVLIHAKGCWVDCPTQQQATDMLEAVKPDIGLGGISSKDKRRRSGDDLSWLSAVDAVRRAKKKRKQAPEPEATSPVE